MKQLEPSNVCGLGLKRFFLALACSLSLAGCGGGGGTGQAVTASSASTANDEITASNALLVAHVADRAMGRYIGYWAMTSVVGNYLASVAPQTMPCSASAPGGQVSAAVLSPTSYDVAFSGCALSTAIKFNSGTLGIDGFSRTSDGSSIAFNSTPKGIQVTDESGTDTVSGTVSYSADANSAGTSVSYRHSGQLNYTRNGKTDQYRNLSITTTLTNSTISFNVASLEIFSPKISVSKLLVTTPVALTIDSQENFVGSLTAASGKDGSRIQYEPVDQQKYRLRCWNSKGELVLDVIKNNTDQDVQAAEFAAAN